MDEQTIRQRISTQRDFFATGATLPLSFRLKQLEQLKLALKRHEQDQYGSVGGWRLKAFGGELCQRSRDGYPPEYVTMITGGREENQEIGRAHVCRGMAIESFWRRTVPAE